VSNEASSYSRPVSIRVQSTYSWLSIKTVLPYNYLSFLSYNFSKTLHVLLTFTYFIAFIFPVCVKIRDHPKVFKTVSNNAEKTRSKVVQ